MKAFTKLSRTILLLSGLFFVIEGTPLFGQTRTPAPAPTTPANASAPPLEDRLSSLEKIYQQEAAKLRRPHLESYLKDLQKLKSLNAKNPELIALIEQEILQIEIAIKDNVPPAFEAPASTSPTPTAITPALSDIFESSSEVRLLERTARVRLRPDLAGNHTASLTTTNLVSLAPLKLGSKSWVIETLPEGTYHIYLLFTHPLTAGGKLEFVLGAGKMVQAISSEHLPEENKYRLWNVIEVPITQEMHNVPFAIKYTPPVGETITFDLKSIYFSTRKL